jgi:hypothetical protein
MKIMKKELPLETMWICGNGTVAMKKQKNYTRSFCPAMSKRCLSAPYTAKNPNWVFKYIFGGKEIMKRKNGMILTFVLTGMVFIATVNAGGTQDASQKTKISIATVIPAGTPFPFGLEHMSKALNESGKFETSVYPGSQLGFAVGWF